MKVNLPLSVLCLVLFGAFQPLFASTPVAQIDHNGFYMGNFGESAKGLCYVSVSRVDKKAINFLGMPLKSLRVDFSFYTNDEPIDLKCVGGIDTTYSCDGVDSEGRRVHLKPGQTRQFDSSGNVVATDGPTLTVYALDGSGVEASCDINQEIGN